MSLTPPIFFNVEVKAESGKGLDANIVCVKDSTTGATMKTGATDLTAAYAEVAKMTPVPITGGSSSQLPRGGRSRKGKKSKGGKSRKARKSLRRK
jgi:hypothetical protein